ncbi:MAG TPA: ATP-binding protein [Alphaproteobacteria bacterium]|nr:HAMP domain-containing protein [Alphaproteobacteria bacterium]USO06018.1 MAG: HAMP domain-containing protein [Rhodospirillales bacterium]HOO81769.1 ATP-binding protein [Alphaproteobacteria bacterium]
MSEGLPIKKFLPRTLFGRSLMILVTPVLLIQIITSFVFFDRHWSKMTTRLAFAVSGELSVITATIKNGDTIRDIENIIAYSGRYLDLDVRFIPDGRLPDKQESSVVQVWESVVAQKLSAELATQISEPFVIHANFADKMIEVFIQLEDGLVRVSLPQRRLFSSSGYVFLLWMIGASLLLLVVAVVFMRNQVRPIRKLAVAADRFGRGRAAPFFKPEGAKEVRQAGHAFLEMRRRIERQVSQRTEMLAGVSHDLRTPLTRMKLQVEMMEEGLDKADMQQDIADMERMIHGYLDFVRGDGDEEFEAVSLAEFFERLVAKMKHQGVKTDLMVAGGLSLVVRPLAFERAISNLLTNAGKYADHIWVSARKDGEKLQIVIEDNGPGVAEDQYEAVFKPFMRVDSSRNAETGGVGLGLPIAMDIIHAHGGKIWLEASEYGGLKVMVRMPL